MQIVFQDSVFKLMQFFYTLNHRYWYSNIFSVILYRTLCVVRVILVLALPSSWIQHLSDLFFGVFFMSHSRVFHSYGDVTITDEGLQILTGLCSALMAIEQWRFFTVPHLLWHGTSVDNGHHREPVRDTYCRPFGSGDVPCTYHVSVFTIL